MGELTMTDFTADKRTKYLAETTESLDALLNDAFLGENQNELKSEFSPGTERKDILIDNTKISLSFLNDSADAVIEVAIQMTQADVSIGEYKSVYDLEGNVIDEIFYLE